MSDATLAQETRTRLRIPDQIMAGLAQFPTGLSEASRKDIAAGIKLADQVIGTFNEVSQTLRDPAGSPEMVDEVEHWAEVWDACEGHLLGLHLLPWVAPLISSVSKKGRAEAGADAVALLTWLADFAQERVEAV